MEGQKKGKFCALHPSLFLFPQTNRSFEFVRGKNLNFKVRKKDRLAVLPNSKGDNFRDFSLTDVKNACQLF